MNTANRNTLWAGIFVDELKKLGLKAVCIAPGSRSTPLALAFAESGIRIYVHSDERSAAYFALGLARASGKPVALVCTSGTAAANFFPAIVEANYGEVPLLVLTADRPAELRESGANQTIDQVKLYGDQVRWFVDAPPPEANFSRHALRAWQSLAARAYETCLSPLPGAVQVNFQFRKPLEAQEVAGDAPAWLDSAALAAAPARVTFSSPRLTPDAAQVDFLVRAVAAAPRGLIIAGPRCPGGEFPAALSAFAARAGYPLLADALSGLRFGAHVNETVLGGYEHFLDENAPRPQLILRFGDVPVSARLAASLDRWEDVPQIHISEIKRWRDDLFRVTHALWAEPLLAVQALLEKSATPVETAWLTEWHALEESAWEKAARLCADPAFEGGILPAILEQLPAGGALFIANSLPVRHLDQFCRPMQKSLTVFANRGASGIDGTLSSALGAAAHLPGLVFVTGDLSFYHDMNGLLAFSRCGIRATIVIINNNGGGIFARLPIATYEPPFTELFRAPHGLTFEHAAQLYNLPYQHVDRATLAAALQSALAQHGAALIEVTT
ncbi:2-succinyl-5-enolpyruvyl-6-hydroxy-3-cyclohexene-1-carboxylic-acid synthase [bacterium]|nr:2-succinyl-5-enolpyruvyl-6-hydroxy-3-cyclohexene-1-carboxylic-acid synthase [bacterium]NCT21102.1 2-succinyl-5-enolpyruvyl-6-hydroxy-3-cyclohexene-1-carboxylic-acid synthase [bacterium]OIO83341.1 MAG: 2-succinyl-5-enolpyruvyl-6-hydroxy-3-cyclohexene-1-carboxylic-acid synthase [Anaerolineae bacterium CG2_30_57_67]